MKCTVKVTIKDITKAHLHTKKLLEDMRRYDSQSELLSLKSSLFVAYQNELLKHALGEVYSYLLSSI